jgi:hypothetical protein
MSQSVSNSIGLSSPKIYTPVDFGSSVMPPLSPHTIVNACISLLSHAYFVYQFAGKFHRVVLCFESFLNAEVFRGFVYFPSESIESENKEGLEGPYGSMKFSTCHKVGNVLFWSVFLYERLG